MDRAAPDTTMQRDADPSAWVERHLGLVPIGGVVLDVACGAGRHVRIARAHGHPVVAVDRDTAAVRAAFAGDPAVEIVTADLEGAPWPFEARTFGGVVVTNYLWRPLLPRIVEAVAEAGVLLYETFMCGHERYGRPRNPDFLLRAGELRTAVAGQLTVVAFEEVDDPNAGSVRQRICAVR